MTKGRGFTLVELVVVIAIIAILAAIIAPNAFKAIDKSRVSNIEGDFRTVKTGAMSYYSDTGTWPANSNCQGGTSNCGLVSNDAQTGWNGPYLEKWPQKNPWGGVYQWRRNTSYPGVSAEARYLTMNAVPGASANKVDLDLDDGNITTGTVKQSGGSLLMEISDDTY